MGVKFRKGSWIIVPLLILSFFSSSGVSAATPGLYVSVYDNFGYNESPPLPDTSGRPLLGTVIEPDANYDFDSNPLFGLYEDFIVKFEGHITSPITGNIRFLPSADDGTKLFIGGNLVDDNWYDKGCCGSPTQLVPFIAGQSQPFTMWFYENGGGAWVELYWDIGNGWEIVPPEAFTIDESISSTTTLAPYFNSPKNLNATFSGTTVTLTWAPGEQSNTEPYMWNITWYEMDSGEQSGGWGIWTYANITTAEITLNSDTSGYGMTRFSVRAGTAPCVGEGQGSCMYGPEAIFDINILLPTTTQPEQTLTTEPEITQEDPVAGPAVPDKTEDEVPQQETQEKTPTTTVPPALEEETQDAIDEIDVKNTSTAALSIAVSNIIDSISNPNELGAAVDNILDKPLTDEQFSAVIDEVFSEPLSTEELTNVLEAVFDEPISDEKFDEVISEVLDQPLSDEQFAAVVDILESDSITEEQVASAVDSVLEEEITEDQATELATSEKVLQSIDGEQAAEIFATIDISDITTEEAEQIVAAVQDAPEEVRDSFEEEVNVFEGAVDSYIPLDSKVSVGVRRVVIAATTVLSITALPTSPSSGSSGNASGGVSGENRRKIK